MSSHVVVHPSYGYRLADITTACNEKDAKVPNSYADLAFVEQNYVANRGNANPEDRECVSVTQTVGCQCSEYSTECRSNEDWYAADLSCC